MTGIYRRATAVNLVWVAMICFFVMASAVTAAIVHRYGQWLYPVAADRLVLLGLMSAAGILVGFAAGWLLVPVLGFLGVMADRIEGRWLFLGALPLTGAWVAVMLTRPPFSVYGNPIWVAIIATSVLLLLAFARGRRPWLLIDVAALWLSFGALVTLGLWLNLAYIRQAVSYRSSVLNAGLILAVVVFLVIAIRFVGFSVRNRLLESRSERDRARSQLWRYGHWLIAVVALLCIVPLYRLATASEGITPTETRNMAMGVLERETEESGSSILPSRNLILISIDTLRSDHLGIYGYDLPTSPNIDHFFSGGVVFTQSFSQTPWTLPSHMSMVTGQTPSTHGVRVFPTVTRGFVDRLPPDARTLAEIISNAGIQTAGFTGGGYVGQEYGFDQGFETFGEAESKRMSEVLDMALPWLRRTSAERFFLFLHSFDVHRYNPPHLFEDIPDGGYQGWLRRKRDESPASLEWDAVGDGFYSLQETDLDFLVFLYDSEIRIVDEQLLRLFSELASLGVLDQTTIIFTADHGENFLEHGTTGHAFNLYNPTLRVPLLIRLAGDDHPGARSGHRVQTIDIAPTVLDLLGLAERGDSSMQGSSLASVIAGESFPQRLIFCEADVLDTQAAVFWGRYKYIHYGILSHNLFDPRFLMLSLKGIFSPYVKGEELFELENDPDEATNLASTEPALAAEFRCLLMRTVRSYRMAARETDSRNVDPMSEELKEQLRSLGYLE